MISDRICSFFSVSIVPIRRFVDVTFGYRLAAPFLDLTNYRVVYPRYVIWTFGALSTAIEDVHVFVDGKAMSTVYFSNEGQRMFSF
jgi:hypothetical protein